MQKTKLLLVSSLPFLLLAHSCSKKVDDLIEKNIEARGGYARLKAVQSKRISGKILQGDSEMPFTVFSKRPNLLRMEYVMNGDTVVVAYDGYNTWAINPVLGRTDPILMDPDQAKDLIELADFDGQLVDHKSKGHKVELAGNAYVKGVKTHKIKVALRNGDILYVYLDQKTLLERRWDDKVRRFGTIVESQTFLDDYRDVNGLMIEHYKETKIDGTLDNTVITERVEFNPDIDDSIFEVPGLSSGS